jgi:hypothetical protein
MSEVRRGDPSLARQMFLLLVAGAVVGGVAITLFERYREALLGWVAADPQPRARLVLGAVAAAAVVPLLACAAYVWRIGVRTLRAGEFPPPGFRVVRDTPVVTGPPAMARGRLLRVFALACAGGAVALVFLLWRFESLLNRP